MQKPVVALMLLMLFGCSKQSAEEVSEVESTTGAERGTYKRAAPGLSGNAAAQNPDALEVYVIDVGQGDATLIVGPLESGHRFTMLIDGGRGRSDKVLETALTDTAGLRAPLDVVVATHYDFDHIGGFTSSGNDEGSLLWIADYQGSDYRGCEPRADFFPTVAIVDPGPGGRSTRAEREWADCVASQTGDSAQPKHVQVAGGANLDRFWELGGGYRAEIVAGGGFVRGHEEQIPNVNTRNEESIALLVSSEEGFHMLITGDLIGQKLPDKIDPETGELTPTSSSENAKLEAALGQTLGEDGVDTEILRTGHHGAANATEASFIEAIQPEVAIISVGQSQNSYGHPHSKTHRTLDEKAVPLILQTNVGLHKPDWGPRHQFENCGDDPNCTQTVLFVAGGTIHIVVTGDTYAINALLPTYEDDVELVDLLFDCDELGCEGGEVE